jgi:hypothetical protein
MAEVDDLLQSGSKQIVLAVVAWLAHGCPPDSESRRRRNHEPPKSGIPKRKKTATHNRLSCKIEYLLRSNHGHSSIASEFFTGDYLVHAVHNIGDTDLSFTTVEFLDGTNEPLPIPDSLRLKQPA